MGCGVLVVSPDPFAPARDLAPGSRRTPRSVDAEGAGRDIAEALRSAGHSVVECDTPADDASARGVVEQAWVVLAGLDMMVIVEDPTDNDHHTGPMCERARELMTDRGPGGSIVWVPTGVPTRTVAARLLELADSGDPPQAQQAQVAHPLEVEPVRPRGREQSPGREPRRRHLRVVRDADSDGAAVPVRGGTDPPVGGPR